MSIEIEDAEARTAEWGRILVLVQQLMVLICENQTSASQGEGSLEVYASHDTDPEALVLNIRVNGEKLRPLRMLPEPDATVALSPREREIVRLVARGHPNKTIAQILEISHWTVSTHLRRIYGKLGVNSRAEMVACVMKNTLDHVA